jgi:DNA ligase (NAD+)
VDQLVSKGLVKSVADIYKLTLEQLTELERMETKSAERILRGIEASEKQPLPRVLNGLGIPFVGERTAQLLAEEFGSLDALASPMPTRCNARRKSGQRWRRVSTPSSRLPTVKNSSSTCAPPTRIHA